MDDLSATIVIKSDQLNADDLTSVPKIYRITNVCVEKGDPRPLRLTLLGCNVPYMPNLTSRKLLTLAFGFDSDVLIGKRVSLYKDENVLFGKDVTSGIRINALECKPFRAILNASSRKKAVFAIESLEDTLKD